MKNQETIQWRPWEAAAFELAKKEAKPIFLSISANWCHWCHVMDEEGFTHPEVIRRMNTDFIPVRVDSDKRPDINSRYNMGGWPTVAILDAEGEVVTGGTYMPTGQLLTMLSDVKREFPGRIQGHPEQGTAALTQILPVDEHAQRAQSPPVKAGLASEYENDFLHSGRRIPAGEGRVLQSIVQTVAGFLER